VVEEHEVDPYAIVLLRPGALPLTSSGKVQRTLCREMFEAGKLDELTRSVHSGENRNGELAAESSDPASQGGPPRPKFLDHVASHSRETLAMEIQQWMLGWLASRVEVPVGELTATAPFTELGMDSLTALELNVEFEKVLGIQMPPTAAYSYPTPAALSLYLADAMLGKTPAEGVAPVDSWFSAMESDARRRR
jgi:acyl carrier protein